MSSYLNIGELPRAFGHRRGVVKSRSVAVGRFTEVIGRWSLIGLETISRVRSAGSALPTALNRHRRRSARGASRRSSAVGDHPRLSNKMEMFLHFGSNIAAGVNGVVGPAGEGHSGPSNEVGVATTRVLPAIQAATRGAMTNTVGNPPRSKVKGNKKEKRLKKGMNTEAKRKNKCSICKSTNHNVARCPEKVAEKTNRIGRGCCLGLVKNDGWGSGF
ncbi:hypothetical protein C2845_PM05G21510 [Panicum miliaceum]|uniref:Uncharacterized protein n=1 Tax=Panicum miliaceum TaxID=4540 RepID=A0A3L6SY08_PANMI|nr:hypothetical protein C2845_PM05G21510 [Panicum miliaceum]